MFKRRSKKPKPIFFIIEGNKLNEKTGILEPFRHKIKVKRACRG